MVAIPHGTVTFVFTDIEGSTALWDRSPDAMRTALQVHDRILRSAIEAHGGYVFSTAGDAFAAAFWTPVDAVAAALAAQRGVTEEQWADPVVVRVRMGIHTGTADERDGDYFGPTLNRTARLMSAAHGGQIVVSLPTEELARDRVPDGGGFIDLGEHPLAGLSRPERVFQLVGRGLVTSFPPLRTAHVRRGNVAAPVTSFVGRDGEVERLIAELGERRLVTLTGPGGVGKTRLAAEAAWLAADDFEAGVWLCELASVATSDAVVDTVATMLSIRRQEGLSMLESIVDALRGQRMLVILDNCEHVLDAVAELAGRIASSCPTVALLATSREPVGIPGEWVWPVPSLRSAEGGVELFCDRAAAADRAFSPTELDTELIAVITERLDGIPLAIELAAARVRSMTLTDLTERLHDRFRLLRGGRRGGLERHQTLRATVQWSYRLLAEEERLLFDRLALFRGGFDQTAAEAVDVEDGLDHVDVADLLAALVDKSMVVADRRGAHTRYRLLETLRQYGEERLEERGALQALRDRHLIHYVAVARRADRDAKGARYAEGVRTLELEWDNLRAALDWAVETGDAAQATSLVETLLQFAVWQQRHELGEWAERAIGLDGAGPAAYGVAAMFATLRGDHHRAWELAATGRAAPLAEKRSGGRLCVEMTARALWFMGERAESWATVQQWDAMFNPDEEPFEAAWAALCLSSFAVVVEPASAAAHVARARRIAAPLGNAALETHIVWATGLVETNAGRYDLALAHFQRAMDSAIRTGDLYFEGWTTRSIALLAASTDPENATPALQRALSRLYATRNWMNLWAAVEALALQWFSNGRTEPAAVLLGHLEAHDIRHPGGGGRSGDFVQQRNVAVAALHATPTAETWMARGAGLDRDEVVRYALDGLANTGGSGT